MVKKRWTALNCDNNLITKLSNELNLNSKIIKILVNRNIDTKEGIERFLNPSLNDLNDPFLLKDMDKAVSRINEAILNKEKVAIYGDYDVDGITGVSVLYLYLKEYLKDLIYYIPDRFTEGYGLSIDALKTLKESGVTLLITVDCGITSVEEAKWAKENEMDIIITDHHNCPDILPKCTAVINPKRKDTSYPYPELAGVGVAFKLTQALNLNNDESNKENLLALTALGTIADIVPLTGENRIIVYHGIKYIREEKCDAISSLLEAASIKNNKVNSYTLGYQIAPRINAAGRIGNAYDALKLFILKDKDEISNKALFLNKLNNIRQETEKEIFDEVTDAIKNNKEYKNMPLIIMAKEGWNSGVIGIIASKITDSMQKPCILISFNDGIGKGSLRSVKGFDIFKALSEVKDLLVKFGGHELAAGLTIKEEKYDEFKERITEYAKGINNTYVSELNIDCEITEEDFNLGFANEIKRLEPFGLGNPEPNFVAKKVRVVSSYDFSDGKHLRLNVEKNKRNIEAIGFFMGKFAKSLKKGENIFIVGNIDINEYQGLKNLQLRIKDIRLG